MQRMRTGLFFAAAALLLAASSLFAQLGPTVTGETGLFELRNAETTPTGRFSFGLTYSQWAEIAGPSVKYANWMTPENPLRYDTGKLGVNVIYGAASNWEISLAAGQRFFHADDRAWAGTINGFDRFGYIRHNETDKFRIGTKVILNPKAPEPVKFALFGGVWIPTQSRNDENALSTHRADWDFGMSFNYNWLTVETSYFYAGDRENFDVPNRWIWGVGGAFKLIPNKLKLITEVNRVIFDGGTVKPDDYSQATLGLRLGLGRAVSVAAAVRANIDRWVRYGTSPQNFGGLLQIAYSPGAPVEEKPKAAPAAEEPPPAPPVAASPVAPAPSPVVAETTPVAKGETATTDEILFDPAKNRLTNIAKAILDGVALRLKNNLSAVCTITGYADAGEKVKDKAALAASRAEAAREYLVKRHGIDASRIKAETKSEPLSATDPTRNRAAVVQVSFR